VFWDYRTTLSQVLSIEQITALEVVALFFSFMVVSTRWLRVGVPSALVGFLLFYSFDFVHYFIAWFGYTSQFIAMPVFMFTFFRFVETRQKAYAAVSLVAFLEVFNGTKPEVIMQSLVMSVVFMASTIIAIKPHKDWAKRCSIVFLFVVVSAVAANTWQLVWTTLAVSESGRVSPMAGGIGSLLKTFNLHPKDYLPGAGILSAFAAIIAADSVARKRISRAALVLMIAFLTIHFGFQDTMYDSTVKSQFVVQALLLLPLFSVFSQRRRIVVTSVLMLLALYVIRAHLSVLLLSVGGIVWHTQRDTFFYSFFLAVLATLGVSAMFGLKKWKPIVLVVIILPLIRHAVYAHGDMFSKEEPWRIEMSRNYEAKVAGKPGPVFMLPELLLSTKDRQRLDLYDSVNSKQVKDFYNGLYGVRRHRDVPPECRVQWLWWPKNVERAFSCRFDLRAFYYQENINPYVDPFDPTFQEVFNPRFVVDFLEAPSGHKITHTGVHMAGGQEILFQEKIGWRPSPFVELFRDGCRNQNAKLGTNLSSTTNYFDHPILKQDFKATFFSPADGCVRIRVQNLPGWRYKLDGHTVTPDPASGVFTYFDTTMGAHEITGTYLPWFGLLYWTSKATKLLLILLCLLVIYRNLQQCRSVREL